jgi:hypothetical protein
MEFVKPKVLCADALWRAKCASCSARHALKLDLKSFAWGGSKPPGSTVWTARDVMAFREHPFLSPKRFELAGEIGPNCGTSRLRRVLCFRGILAAITQDEALPPRVAARGFFFLRYRTDRLCVSVSSISFLQVARVHLSRGERSNFAGSVRWTSSARRTSAAVHRRDPFAL